MSNSKSRGSSIDRRRFLSHTWGGVVGGIGLALLPAEATATPRFRTDPFTLGVASGDPTSDGIVLWTRLAPNPLEPEALGKRPIAVRWRVCSDDGCRRIVQQGYAWAHAELAHSVHVEVAGLRPHRHYFYQFDVGGVESAIGRFRTAPREDTYVEGVEFAFVTCQDWPSGHYTAYRDLVQQDLDLVLHLGDYIYEYAIGTNRRGIPTPEGYQEETVDLRTYRLRHSLYKSDPDLQAAHARFPFAVIWDDHEVQNDYSGLAPEGGSPSRDFALRRAAAYQAYYEHMPIRSPFVRGSNSLRIYRRLRYGDLLDISMLDDRQYRTDNPCGDGESLRCAAAQRDDYTMLGWRQERWLSRQYRKSQARFNVTAQQLLIAELEHLPYQDERYWNDAWDGYPAARQRLLEEVAGSGVSNPIFLTGDWHSTFVNDLKLDFKRPETETVATEFVTPALTTGGDGTPYGPYYSPMIPFNPHIKYYEGDRRGYFKASVRRDHARFDLRFVTSVENDAGVGYPERSWVVEDGVAGAQDA